MIRKEPFINPFLNEDGISPFIKYLGQEKRTRNNNTQVKNFNVV